VGIIEYLLITVTALVVGALCGLGAQSPAPGR
jgi:hypothetical protein